MDQRPGRDPPPERCEHALIELDATARLSHGEIPRLEPEIRQRLAHWRGMLRREVPEAREILRPGSNLGRIVRTPPPGGSRLTSSSGWPCWRSGLGSVPIEQRLLPRTVGLGSAAGRCRDRAVLRSAGSFPPSIPPRLSRTPSGAWSPRVRRRTRPAEARGGGGTPRTS